MPISVALATHQGERYLPAQLRSLARQTLQPQELIVYDDGSSDGTAAVVERFAERAPFPVQLIRGREQVGAHEAFHRAASACSGQAVALCDQDDVWLEGKLERCARLLVRHSAALVVHRAAVVRHDLAPTGRRFPRTGPSRTLAAGALDPLFTFPGFAMVFDRAVLDWGDWNRRPGSRHWRGPMSHDEWIGLLASSGGPTVLTREVLALYRQHGAQQFGAARRGPRETVARLGGPSREACEQRAEVLSGQAAYLRETESPDAAGRNVRAIVVRDVSARAWRGRAAVRTPGMPRRRRVARLGSMARAGSYGSPDSGGLGIGAAASDVAAILRR